MTAYVIAGAGTDIGKTYVTCGLIRALRAQGRAINALKPVLSGYDAPEGSDSARILEALDQPVTDEAVAAMSPWRYAAPLAPNLAARAEGKRVDYEAILSACRDATRLAPDTLLIESAGGIMSPLSDSETMLDLIADLDVPTIIVGGTYLGAISHTLTAIVAAQARGLHIAAAPISESADDNVGLTVTVKTLKHFASNIPFIGIARNQTDFSALAALI
jgi:dethiobiotin synthetase